MPGRQGHFAMFLDTVSKNFGGKPAQHVPNAGHAHFADWFQATALLSSWADRENSLAVACVWRAVGFAGHGHLEPGSRSRWDRWDGWDRWDRFWGEVAGPGLFEVEALVTLGLAAIGKTQRAASDVEGPQQAREVPCVERSARVVPGRIVEFLECGENGCCRESIEPGVSKEASDGTENEQGGVLVKCGRQGQRRVPRSGRPRASRVLGDGEQGSPQLSGAIAEFVRRIDDTRRDLGAVRENRISQSGVHLLCLLFGVPAVRRNIERDEKPIA